jgi:methyl-accepting chemotaxis protein
MNSTLVSALLQPTNLVFFGMMIVLALIDIASYFWKAGEHHRNFKGEIVGLGILGTFFGIFIGLQTFDPRSIQESIPPLLDGLKTAFLTSIAGMGISMLLTVFQTIVRTRAALRADDPLQALVQDLLTATTKANQVSSANQTALLEQIRNGRMEQRDEALKVRQVFETSFATMNASLQEALAKLSEGASKEIIKALEDVIRDFNENLTQQFGENFQQLNAACLKLVEWQDNYKGIIEQVEATLKQSASAIEATDRTLQSIAEKNSEFAKLCNRLGDAITTGNENTQALNEHLKQQKSLAELVGGLVSKVKISIEVAAEQLRTATERTEHTISTALERAERGIMNADDKFSETTAAILSGFDRLEHENLATITKVSKTFSDHCNTVAESLRDAKQGLDELTQKIQGSLTTQSQSLSDLTKRTTEMTDKTREELAASLRQMNNALSSLTTQFGANYREFLASIERLMPK